MIPLQVTPEVSSSPIAITVVVLYFVAVVGLGGYFFSKSRESKANFWIADGKIGTSVQIFAFFAVSVSAGSFLGFGGFAYANGAAFAMLILAAVGTGWLFTQIFLAGPIRRAGVYTVPGYLHMRYQSKRVRLVGATLFALMAWAYLIPQLNAGAITIQFVFPWAGYQMGVIIASLIFALYVSLGGMWAVTWTDFVQGILMFVLAILPVPLILMEFGGVGNTINAALEVNPAFAGSVMPWQTHLSLGLVWILAIISMPQLGQRILSSKDDKTARRGLLWSNVLYVFSFILLIFLVAGAAVVTEPNLGNPDFFYYAVLTEYFGPMVQGLGAAAILATVMSTTDALLIALSASISHDIPETLDWELSDRKELIIAQVVIWGGAFTTALVALNPPGLILDMTSWIAGALACGFFPALVIGTWWKRANAPGAIAAMIVGVVTYGALFFGDIMSIPFTEALIAIPVGFLTFIIVSLATRRPRGEELLGFQYFHSDSIDQSVFNATEADD